MKLAQLAACMLGVATPGSADDITVFAASSLKTALDQIAADWQAETGHVALLSYDSSARLAKQIAQGAPADLFFSAAETWMDGLETDGLIVPESRSAVLGNQLVLVAHGQGTDPVDLALGIDLAGMLGGGKLAMGAVDKVPVGQYGKEALESLGVWQALAPHVAEVETARAVLALVGQGEADLGIVYASDAVADDRADDKVSVVGVFPEESHTPIVFSLALTTSANPIAGEFLAYLQSDKADAVFADLGFTVLP